MVGVYGDVAGTFSTETLDSTEPLAVRVTCDLYASGRIDHGELERRLHVILGLDGPEERARVLHTDELVDVTYFGSTQSLVYATGWRWPD